MACANANWIEYKERNIKKKLNGKSGEKIAQGIDEVCTSWSKVLRGLLINLFSNTNY